MAHRGPVTAGVVVLALALAGCTGPEPGATPESLPLDGYRAAMAAASDFFHSEEGRLLREELIATCMAEHGFEYVPSLRPTGLGPVLAEGVYSEELGLVVGSREYAERYGYGTTTRPLGDPLSAYLAETAEWVDPDLAYLASMSPVERRAYDLALLGEQKEWTAADWENAEAAEGFDGCQGRAEREAAGELFRPRDAELRALQADLDAMEFAADDDPRLAAARQAWATCMADRGHPGLTELWDAHLRASELFDAAHAVAYADLDPDSPAYAETGERRLTEELDAVAGQEIALAVADLDCREEARYDAIELEVRHEYEREFVASHRAELERWLLTAGVETGLGTD